MKRKVIFSGLLLICFTACSATRPPPVVSPPSTITLDASVALVDTDAYQITLPEASQVSINLPIVDGSGPNGERIAPLRTGQPAPFNGVLFNGPSVARIEVEFRGQQAQCQINRQADIDRVVAMSIRDIQNLTASLEAQRRMYDVMIRSRDSELDRLYNHARNTNQPINYWPYIGIGLGGLVIGAGAATTIYFLSR